MRSLWKVFLYFGTFILATAISAFADPSPLPSGVPVVAIAGTVNGWAAWVNAFTNGALIMSIGAALEFILRLLPSKQPLSIAYALDDTFKAIGSFFKALGDALDKILPNRLSGGGSS